MFPRRRYQCVPQPTCESGVQYLKGYGPVTIGKCVPCSNMDCGPAQHRYRAGSCGGTSNLFVCKDQPICPNETYDLANATASQPGACVLNSTAVSAAAALQTPARNTTAAAARKQGLDAELAAAEDRLARANANSTGPASNATSANATNSNATAADAAAAEAAVARALGALEQWRRDGGEGVCAAGLYLGGVGANSSGHCAPCSNKDCGPAVYRYRAGSCSGTSNLFVCRGQPICPADTSRLVNATATGKGRCESTQVATPAPTAPPATAPNEGVPGAGGAATDGPAATPPGDATSQPGEPGTDETPPATGDGGGAGGAATPTPAAGPGATVAAAGTPASASGGEVAVPAESGGGGDDTTLYIIIGAGAGGFCVVLVVGYLCCKCHRERAAERAAIQEFDVSRSKVAMTNRGSVKTSMHVHDPDDGELYETTGPEAGADDMAMYEAEPGAPTTVNPAFKPPPGHGVYNNDFPSGGAQYEAIDNDLSTAPPGSSAYETPRAPAKTASGGLTFEEIQKMQNMARGSTC